MMPAERLGSLYDFALFLQSRPIFPPGFVDVFGASEEEIVADEALWEEQFAASGDTLLRLAEEAIEAYHAGQTTPMEFDEKGRLRR
jgi:hypothetical protein